MDPARATGVSPAANIYQDGLGERRRASDASGSDTELLCLRRQLTAVPSFEFALRERTGRLASFRHTYFGRVRSIDRLSDPGSTLAVVSDFTKGVRLSQLLSPVDPRPVIIDINASLHLIRQLVSAVAMLHENAPDVAHGAIGPERVIVTSNARVVIVEYVLGAALEQLHFSSERYWKELRVALPPTSDTPSFDQRTDVTQIGVVALSLVLGRLLTEHEHPAHLGDVLASAWAISSRGGLEPLPPGLRAWLARALQLDPRHSFESAIDASAELDKVLDGEDDGEYEGLTVETAEPEPAPPVVLEAPPPVLHEKTEPRYGKSDAWDPYPAVAVQPPRPIVVAEPKLELTPIAVPPGAKPVLAARETKHAAEPSYAKPVVEPKPVAQEPKPAVAAVEPHTPVAVMQPPPVVAVAAPKPVVTVVEPKPVVAAVEPKPVVAAPEPKVFVFAPEPKPFAFAPEPKPFAIPATLTPLDVSTAVHADADFNDYLDEVEKPGVTPARSVRRPARLAAAAGVLIALSVVGTYAAQRYFAAPAASTTTGVLYVASHPAGAQVLVDNAARGTTPMTLTLAAGSHVVEFRGTGDPRTVPVTVTAGAMTSHYVDLPPITGTGTGTGSLQIRTDPAGARVSVDGTPRGKSPLLVEGLTPGEHAVVLQSDFGTVKQTVTVQAENTASLVVPLTAGDGAAPSGWVSLKAPAELQMFENKKLIGTSQSDRIMVSAGRHEIEIVNEALGYRASTVVQVSPGKVAPLKIEWPKGSVALNAVPWAEVWIDGEKSGETPIGNLSLPIGPHEIIFRHPDLGEQRYPLTVTLSAPARVSVDLRKKP